MEKTLQLRISQLTEQRDKSDVRSRYLAQNLVDSIPKPMFLNMCRSHEELIKKYSSLLEISSNYILEIEQLKKRDRDRELSLINNDNGSKSQPETIASARANFITSLETQIASLTDQLKQYKKKEGDFNESILSLQNQLEGTISYQKAAELQEENVKLKEDIETLRIESTRFWARYLDRTSLLSRCSVN